MAGTRRCYLICSDVPLFNRRGTSTFAVNHYLGHTSRPLAERLKEHMQCALKCQPHAPGDDCPYSSARILSAMMRAGGTLTITRSWSGGWQEESRLKGYGNAAKMCPRCCGDIAMYRRPRGMKRGVNLWKRLLRMGHVPQSTVLVDERVM